VNGSACRATYHCARAQEVQAVDSSATIIQTQSQACRRNKMKSILSLMLSIDHWIAE
jgi:uncharacterized membrane protein